jgi:hypothetical protein
MSTICSAVETRVEACVAAVASCALFAASLALIRQTALFRRHLNALGARASTSLIAFCFPTSTDPAC